MPHILHTLHLGSYFHACRISPGKHAYFLTVVLSFDIHATLFSCSIFLSRSSGLLSSFPHVEGWIKDFCQSCHMKEGNSINFMVNKFPRNQASGLRFQKMPLPKVFRVLKLVLLQCPAKPTVLLGLFWCFKSADTHILVNQRPHHEAKTQSTWLHSAEERFSASCNDCSFKD